MLRRSLLAVFALVLLWAAPAAAQSYGDVLGEGEGRTPTVVVGQAEVPAASTGARNADAGDLARTGSNILPEVQAAIVLIGGGALLTLVARRRRTQRRSEVAA